MYSGVSASNLEQSFSHSQESLYTLATDTGGKALLDNNDLARGIVQAQQSISDYYILSYYTTNTDLNGKFRRIHISLANNEEAKLDFRQGYFAGKEFKKFNDTDRERQLEEALISKTQLLNLPLPWRSTTSN